MQDKNKQQLQQELISLNERKQKLILLKEQVKDKWSQELQNELDSVVVKIVDLEEVIENMPSGYNVPKGSEHLLHLKIVRGRRFNPNTGKEESLPYIQVFTKGEWDLFKQNAKLLGYFIIEVLHDPFGDTKDYLAK